MPNQFSTVSLMREDPTVIARFISYYRGLGATQIHIFLDGPINPVSGLARDGVVMTECNSAFWEGLGGRPSALEDRQHAVYRQGLRSCPTEWMLVVDADELVFGDRSVAQFLGWLPDTVDSVRLATTEAVWGPGDDINVPFGSTYFRTAWRSEQLWRTSRRLIYGEATSFLRSGLAGHIAGKQFLRTNRVYSKIGNHTSEQDGKDISVWAARLGPSGEQMYVGHFDAISFDRWKRKWLARIRGETETSRMAGTRKLQMQAIADAFAGDPDKPRALFTQLYGMSQSRFRVLSNLNYAFRRDILGALSRTGETTPPVSESTEIVKRTRPASALGRIPPVTKGVY